MSFWTFVFLCVLVSSLVRLLNTVSDNDRKARVAKVEADLKWKLVDRLQDPVLVQRLIEARLPEDLSALGEKLAQAQKDQPPAPARSEGPKIIVLAGLVAFLVGGAFLVCAGLVDDDFIVPGSICCAVGLALLTYATSHKQILRHTGGSLPPEPEPR